MIFTGEDDEYYIYKATYTHSNSKLTAPTKLNIEFTSNYSAASSSLILAIAAAGLRPLGQVREQLKIV